MFKKYPALLIAGIFLFLSCPAAWAGDDGVSAQVSVDRAVIFIGDRVKFSVDVNYRAGTVIDFPEFKENKIGDFEIKDSGRGLKKGLFGADTMKRRYYITSYSIGKHQIPPIEIKYKKKGGKDWNSVRTRALNISVESILPKGKMPADIKDVKGPLSYFEINWFIVTGILILFLAVISAIMYKFRKIPAPIKLPHETALEELEAIRGNFLRNSDVKEYYAGVSDCVRRYIERLFKLKAPEMTTEEFLESLKESTALSLDQKDLLKDFLNACDLVKFAKYNPAKGEMESVSLAAKKFIEETKRTDNNVRV